MRATSFHPLPAALALAPMLALLLGLPAQAQPSPGQYPSVEKAAAGHSAAFQPLHSPATGEQHPGKIVWADLFTTDATAATKFYCDLFGWTSRTTDQKEKSYTVFSNHGQPVAGLVPRGGKNPNRPARWISYIAVADIKATLTLATDAGGKIKAPARDFPDRGAQAIIADNEESPIGLLQSSSGDSVEDEPNPGDWNWAELYAKEPKSTSSFYGHVFGYTVAPDDRTERKNDYLLSSEGIPRAGVAPRPDREEANLGWLGVIRVASIDETLAQVTKLGGEVLVAARTVAYESRFAIIADPTGGTVGVIEYVDNANPATRP